MVVNDLLILISSIINVVTVLDLAEEVWETFPACYTAQRMNLYCLYGDFIKNREPIELSLDLTLSINVYRCGQTRIHACTCNLRSV